MHFLRVIILFFLSINVWASPTFIIDSVINEDKDKKWRDKGIGFGVAQELTQIITDSGLFSSPELNAEIIDMINQHRDLAWIQGQEPEKTPEFPDIDIIFKARILSIKEKRKKISIGFATKYKTTLKVKFELKALINDKYYSAKDSGKSDKQAVSFFLEAKDDKIPFNQTMIGSAVISAAKKTTEKLLKKLKKEKQI